MGLSGTRITADGNMIAIPLVFVALKPTHYVIMDPLLFGG